MTTDQNKLVVRRYIEEVANTGNLDRIAEFISPDYVEVYRGTRYPIGIEGAGGRRGVGAGGRRGGGEDEGSFGGSRNHEGLSTLVQPGRETWLLSNDKIQMPHEIQMTNAR